jgi:hypothetical protein
MHAAHNFENRAAQKAVSKKKLQDDPLFVFGGSDDNH